MSILIRITERARYVMIVNKITRRGEFEEYPLVTGDTLPMIDFLVENEDETPFNLTGWTPKFYLKKAGLESVVNLTHPECVIDTAVSGTCHYEFDDHDLLKEGIHFGELELVNGEQKIKIPYSIRFNVRTGLV